ncbi:ABC transporter substrate-binding protein [Acidiferrimicrobium sp. IK]|uniref:ABC transporter substrate-binding protein n=1 Tax=Acidiferrimicrobium sp. IK TaxID=2871700 RepID=UPI0021CB8BD4|nr:ABC transporter substrate-binding protein [Acidiferrimicrobium sp. IK]MCU4183327.1 ABC transporter substrate-binding protein [Acidiferrimicrobium sp. IK]
MKETDQLSAHSMSRRSFLRYTSAAGAAAALTATLAACGSGTSKAAPATAGSTSPGGGTAQATQTPQGTITGTLAYQLSSGFDPMNASAAPALCANAHVFEGLVDLDPITREPYLALAKEQPTVSADGLTWTATLRDGAKFSDGTPVTADDVAWSFNRVVDPANAAIIAGFVPFIESATATGPSTVAIKLTSAFTLFPTRVAVVKIVPKAKTATAALARAFDSNPIGSGPFQVDSSNATTGLVLSNNTAYNGPRPALVSKIVLNTTPDDNARLNDLEGGQSQAIEAVPYANVTSLTKPLTADVAQSFNCLFLMFNCSAPPFNDKRVRQALFYGIDTAKVIATALDGYGVPATSYLDPANPGYQQAATVYSYDPKKAKALLAAAGVSNLSFELVTTNVSFIANSAPVIVDSWKSIGVKATINTLPSASVYSNSVPSNGFRVLAASGDPSIYGADVDLMLRWFYYGKTWPEKRERWTDATAVQVSKLIDQAAAASGTQQRTLWKQIFDIVADEVPLYPLYHIKIPTGVDPTKLTNFKPAKTTGLYFLGVGRKG